MKMDHVEVHAEPFFSRATCPKDRSDMIKLDNGWLSVCWYCEQCGYPYELQMRKMHNVSQGNLTAVLAEHYKKNPKKSL